MDLESARETLLDHAKNPRNRILQAPNLALNSFVHGDYKNPDCGDRVSVYLDLADGRIQTCSLLMQGCSMCLASASIMSENLKLIHVQHAIELCNLFEVTLKDCPEKVWPTELSEFEFFFFLRKNPAKLFCSLVSWYSLRNALIPKIRRYEDLK